jgi:beta-glucosidase
MRMLGRSTVFGALAVALAVSGCRSAAKPSAPARASGTSTEYVALANAALAKMTLDDEITLVTGAAQVPGDPHREAGFTSPMKHGDLDVPGLFLNDSPNGVGNGATGVTNFPTAIAIASTFSRELAAAFGKSLGEEWSGKGSNVGLGPAMNIDRVPYNGRTAEYFSEDPFLSARMAVAEIKSIQSQHVLATAKHFAANNQETDRSGGNSVVSERALREIYLPAFEASVTEAGVGAFMCAYNKVNGTYACENPHLLTEILRGEWGFTGFVMSDWGALHSTAPSTQAGTDMDMAGMLYPKSLFYGARLKDAVMGGAVSRATLDTMVRRILTSMYRVGLFSHRTTVAPDVSTPSHRELAQTLCEEGTVLLKNERSALPIAKTAKVAVIGSGADAAAQTAIGGSGKVIPSEPPVTPLAGIRALVGAEHVTYAVGSDASGDPTLIGTALEVAATADVAVVVVSDAQSEGSDHAARLPGNQDDLIAQVSKVAKKTVVVLNTGSALVLPWADQVDAIVESWYAGQRFGTALARILFGDVNPSGKLPVTFPRAIDQLYAREASQYPGVAPPGGDHLDVHYDEGILVGYRWFDQKGLAPLFPFGHGLSYTSFGYGNLRISPDHGDGGKVTVVVTVTNTGRVAGKEVAELFLGFPAAAGEPPRQLKGFEKVQLPPGESKDVTFELDRRAFSYWKDSGGWTTAAGAYQLLVGGSSRSTPLAGTFTMQ